MNKIIVAAIFVISISMSPVLSQEAAPEAVLPEIPEITAITAAPAPEPAPVQWTETAAETAAPIVESPAEAVIPVEPPTIVEAPVSNNWLETGAQNAPQITYIHTERNELIDRMSANQVFIYQPTNALGQPIVPEPGGIVALAVGLSGMAATISKRRTSRKQ